MKKLLLVASVAALGACAVIPSRTGGGMLFQDVKEVELVTEKRGSKTGEACSMNILGLVSVGDSSLEAAKKDGRIKTVASVDAKINSILGVFGKRCTIVKGQ